MYALSNLMKLKDDKYVGGISYTINFIYLLHLSCVGDIYEVCIKCIGNAMFGR